MNKIYNMKFKNWYNYFILLMTALMLLIPAFYNHYPLVNPDTAIYIESGFLPEMPNDRPITYGLLVRMLSLNGLSLWLVIFSQALLLTWLIDRIRNGVIQVRAGSVVTFAIVCILSTCTGLSWVASQIQPDVFTSIALLSLIVLVMGRESNKINNVLYFIFFLSVATHLSHPVLFIAILVLLLVANRFLFVNKAALRTKKLSILLVLSLSSIIVMLTPLHKSKHIFFVGSLLEKGVLKTYLNEHCIDHNYKICKYKDSLPSDVNQFWWDPNSPLYKIGDWKSVKPEFNQIIHDIFSDKKYVMLYAKASMNQTVQQSITYNIGDGNQTFKEGSYVHKMISKYFLHELDHFDNSVQNNNVIYNKIGTVNKLFSIFLGVCSLVLICVLLIWKRLKQEMRVVILIVILGVLLNNIDCAMFGIVNGRYGCKVVWLIPLCVLLFIFSRTKKGDDTAVLPK